MPGVVLETGGMAIEQRHRRRPAKWSMAIWWRSDAEQRIACQAPACLVGGADQTAVKMARPEGWPAAKGAITARLPVQQPAGRVVPRHQLAVQQDMAMPTGRSAIF